MWKDHLFVGRQVADIESVARFAVGKADAADAAREIERYMVPDDECPIVLVGQGIIALVDNDEAVAAYLTRFCEDDEDIPWGLRDHQ